MKSRVKKVVQNLSRNGRPNWSDYCPRVDEKIAIFVNGILGVKKSNQTRKATRASAKIEALV